MSQRSVQHTVRTRSVFETVADTQLWRMRLQPKHIHHIERERDRWLVGLVGLIIALRPQTPKHIRGGWSHDTDTSEPVQLMVMGLKYSHCPIRVRTGDLFLSLVHDLTNCSNQRDWERERRLSTYNSLNHGVKDSITFLRKCPTDPRTFVSLVPLIAGHLNPLSLWSQVT
jgi:hypothetical protein